MTPSFVANRGPASGGYSASVGSAMDTTVTLNASSSHAGAMVTVTYDDADVAPTQKWLLLANSSVVQ